MAIAIVGSVAASQSTGVASKFQDRTVSAGSILECHCAVAIPSGSSPVTSVQAQLMVSGSPSGSPISMTPVFSKSPKYETRKATATYRSPTLSAGDYRVTVTGADASSNITMAIVEISDAGSLESISPGLGESENGVTSCTPTATPNSGNPPQDSGLAWLIVGTGDGTALSFNTPSGWTKLTDVNDGSSGKQTLAVFHKTITAATPEQPTVTTTAGAQFGFMAGVYMQQSSVVVTPTVQYLKLRAENNAAQGLSGITVDAFLAPDDAQVLGPKVFSVPSQAWDSSEVDGGVTKAVMLVPVPPDTEWFVSGLTLDAGDRLLVVGGKLSDMSHGFVTYGVGEVIEVIEGV